MSKLIRLVLLTLIVFIPAAAGAAHFHSSAKGTTTAGFLQLGVGARAVAMGGAFTAIAEDANALTWNPAALRQVKGNSLSLMHAAYLDSSNFECGSIVHSMDKSSVGLGIQYLSAGSLDGRDDYGLETGNFKPTNMAVVVGYAHDIGAMSIGLTAKYIQSKIVSSAQTEAVDVGLLLPRLADGKFRWGLAASNIGGKMKFDEQSEPLPLLIKLGCGYQVQRSWLLSLDGGFPRDNNPYFAVGTEYLVPTGKDMSLAGRAGYNSQTGSDITGFSGFSFGAGFNFKKLTLDYGFVPFGDLGSTHRVSLSVNF